MFKLEPNPTFRATVNIPRGGAISFEFRHKTKSQVKDYIERAQTAGDKGELPILAEVVVGWAGVDVEYSEANLGVLLENYPAAGAAILGTWARELGDAKLGN